MGGNNLQLVEAKPEIPGKTPSPRSHAARVPASDIPPHICERLVELFLFYGDADRAAEAAQKRFPFRITGKTVLEAVVLSILTRQS
jgi:hypothetical protein